MTRTGQGDEGGGGQNDPTSEHHSPGPQTLHQRPDTCAEDDEHPDEGDGQHNRAHGCEQQHGGEPGPQ